MKCYHNIFHPNLSPCPNEGVYVSTTHLGNLTDGWVWCEEHKPKNSILISEKMVENDVTTR